MAIYLNTNAAYKDFEMLRNDRYFIDKSAMIQKVSERIKTKNRYLCITKPRRFGKTSALNMLGAYYGKAYPSGSLFEDLEISRSESYVSHLNKYNIVNISMNCMPETGNTYADYLELVAGSMKDDIKEAYETPSWQVPGRLP